MPSMTDMAILHLTLKREWFDRIARGEKKEEFRHYKPYWKKRLEGHKYDAILFRNGYASNAPEMLVEYLGLRRGGSGQNADYVIRLGRVISTKRWRSRG
jgi:hypothetical protein